MASFCIACRVFHVIMRILFNCSDESFRVAKAMIGARKLHFLYYVMFASNFAPELVPRILGLFSSILVDYSSTARFGLEKNIYMDYTLLA